MGDGVPLPVAGGVFQVAARPRRLWWSRFGVFPVALWCCFRSRSGVVSGCALVLYPVALVFVLVALIVFRSRRCFSRRAGVFPVAQVFVFPVALVLFPVAQVSLMDAPRRVAQGAPGAPGPSPRHAPCVSRKVTFAGCRRSAWPYLHMFVFGSCGLATRRCLVFSAARGPRIYSTDTHRSRRREASTTASYCI